MLNIDGDQISIAIDLDQGARLASVQWRDMQFAVPFRGQDLSWGWFSMVPFAGRIKDGIIKDSKGSKYQLPNNFDPPHALIGYGAQSSWEDIGGGRQHLELPSPFNGATVTQSYEILDNAIRYSPRGSRIALTVSLLDSTKLRLLIRDYGSGISNDLQATIFKQFASSYEDSSALRGGMGLSLPISHGFMQQMQGCIGILSSSPKGSTFYIDLLLAAAEQR